MWIVCEGGEDEKERVNGDFLNNLKEEFSDFLSNTNRRVVVVLGCLRLELVIGQPGRHVSCKVFVCAVGPGCAEVGVAAVTCSRQSVAATARDEWLE